LSRRRGLPRHRPGGDRTRHRRVQDRREHRGRPGPGGRHRDPSRHTGAPTSVHSSDQT